jgi:hypothetical protein
VCEDGSIFVDRDGEHFGHVLEYMRDGVVSVAAPGAQPSVALLRALKREFGYYCIELVSEQAVEPELPKMAYVMGGKGGRHSLASMERYEASSGQWSVVAPMGIARSSLGACVIAGEIYASGGIDANREGLEDVEKYSPSSDTWSAMAPLLGLRSNHAAVAMGSAMYVLGGYDEAMAETARVLRYDSAQDAWREVASMPAARIELAACAVGSDIFAFGGEGERVAQSSVFKYDTVADIWSTLAPMPVAGYGLCASVLDGLVYIVGTGASRCEVLRFDPLTFVWSTVARTSRARQGGTSFVIGGFLYAAGGIAQSSVERYDVANNTWSALVNRLEGRLFARAVTIGSVGPAEDQDLFDSLIAKVL